MNRIASMFRRLRRERRCGLIAYVTCGDPSIDATVRAILALEGSGADAVELGVPFSDPIADGPVIQAASWRALRRGTTMAGVFAVAKKVRELSGIPLVGFTYLNPVLQFGTGRFADGCREAGIDAVLVTDLPAEESREVREALRRRSIGSVFLLAPTSTEARIRLVDRSARGFVYYVSTSGVTGERRELPEGLLHRLDEVRAAVRHPLAVGFGISEASHYALLSPHCDAVVVGSAIVRAMAEGDEAGAPERAAAVVRRILGRDESLLGRVPA